MNELMTREEFLSERNAIYEPDAVADEKTDEPSKGPRIVIPGAGKDEQLTADGITVSEIVIKNRQSRQYAGLILFITAVAGVVAGAVLYGDMTVVISDEMLKNYLSGRIHGGFFGNAAASFIAALIWCERNTRLCGVYPAVRIYRNIRMLLSVSAFFIVFK